MDFTLIITVALAAAIIVIVLMLVAIIVYQRWRIGEKNAALARFIRENLELMDELNNK
jgi:cbb3-type cytochrome oxidase subunit 3